MEEMVKKVIAALKEVGIDADCRFPAGIMPRLEKTYAAVEVERLQASQGGLGDYLGMVEQEDFTTAECYGRKLSVGLLIRFFAPSAAMLQISVQRAMERLCAEELTLEESRFDELCDCYVRDMHLRAEVYFYALSQAEGQSFYDFKLEGEFQ